MLVPVVGAFVLLTKQPRVVVATILAFCFVCLLFYIPFFVQGNTEYLRRVFFVSFEHGQLTHINAYNIWALWFQIPNSTRVLGISLEIMAALPISPALYLEFTRSGRKGPVNESRQDASRRFAIIGAYLCIAPFVLLTQMHERYLAMGIPLIVLAGFLDRRLMAVGIGFFHRLCSKSFSGRRAILAAVGFDQ